MTITLPFLRMILHFSHIGFTDGRTFMLVPPVADIFPQQIQAPCERMLNYYSRIDTVFNWKFSSARHFLNMCTPNKRTARRRLHYSIKLMPYPLNRRFLRMREEVSLP
jgi:hypothetical protein